MSTVSFDVALEQVNAQPSLHFKRPIERPFTRAERDSTTILFGGLTWKHERLIQGVLEGLGYKAQPLPVPDRRAFQSGKEYGNNGQCNPTYFTVGNLVRYLESLRAQGVPQQEILDRYVFFTAGACGPCRFGMYEAEYRLALRNAGFDGFRVLLFQQTGGLDQADPNDGLEMNLEFFLGILNALTLADVLNEAAYAVRPYELNPGDTDAALEKAIEHMYQFLRGFRWLRAPASWPSRLRRTADWTVKFLQQFAGSGLHRELEQAAGYLTQVPVDRLRVRPIVKITGEFWAQTTEGDGNFNMFRFLEREGAQVLVEPVGTWITYLIHQVVQKNRDWKGLEEGALLPSWGRLPVRARIEARYLYKQARLKFAEALFRRHYARAAAALEGLAHPLADQYELQRLGHPYYNSRAGGGEGHLEVAKNIYYSNRELCHMVLSLKPFGCMPSTQSDGAQAAVVSRYPDMIYLPIETSGEGEINAHSRVQMALGDARQKARREFDECLQRAGLTLEQCRAWLASHPEAQRAGYRVPKSPGVVGVAANFVLHIAERIRREGRA